MTQNKIRLVVLGDTHRAESKIKIPDGDILIHVGDFDIYDFENLAWVNKWFGELPHKHKIMIAGNHDLLLEKMQVHVIKSLLPNVTYLQNEETEIEGIKFWGSPITPIFFNWAFMGNGELRQRVWSKIPEGIDILMTHGPAYGILDMTTKANGDFDINVGCPLLRDRIKEIKPKYHFFGHIHEAHGQKQVGETFHANVSVMDKYYSITNPPLIIDYERK